MFVLLLSHILTYAPSFVYEHASIKTKSSQKRFVFHLVVACAAHSLSF
jgi:hypothetical protein